MQTEAMTFQSALLRENRIFAAEHHPPDQFQFGDLALGLFVEAGFDDGSPNGLASNPPPGIIGSSLAKYREKITDQIAIFPNQTELYLSDVCSADDGNSGDVEYQRGEKRTAQ